MFLRLDSGRVGTVLAALHAVNESVAETANAGLRDTAVVCIADIRVDMTAAVGTVIDA